VGPYRGRSLPEWGVWGAGLPEEQAEAFSFDILDATKLIPEEWCQQIQGLNRNPEPFAETEQVLLYGARRARH
jgi:catalase